LPFLTHENIHISILDRCNDRMKAVIFKGPGKVVIEDRPIPKIQHADDIIVKVEKVLFSEHRKG
jgi:hypothetical protein